MPIALRSIQMTPNSDTLNSLSLADLLLTTAAGAGVANTTVQAAIALPFNYKIRKVSVYLPSVDAVAGTDSFNLVVGTGAYTQNNAAANDNFDVTGLNAVTAATGNAVFAADVPVNSANTFNAATGTGWQQATTGGAWGVFVPTSYDAVYPQITPLTLRLTTTAGTGAIGAGARFVIAYVPTALRRATAGVAGQAIVLPGVDF